MLIVLLAFQVAVAAPPSASAKPARTEVVCPCPPRAAGAAPEAPLAQALDALGVPVLVACGELIERLAPDRARAEEVWAYVCGAIEPTLALSPLEVAEVHAVDGGLEILELASWPFGAAGEWIDVPIWRNSVVLFPELGPRVERSLAFEAPHLSAAEIRAAIEDYARWLRAPDTLLEPEAMAGRVLAAALAGNAEARNALASWNANSRVDDELAEVWTDASDLYQAYVAATGKVPPLGAKSKN